MNIQYMKKAMISGFLAFLALLIFTRFYNLDFTARFTEDESKDLVGMHQIFVDRKLTLVGPTNEQGTKVFSSLTFYMLLPAAIIGKFDPISPHYGAAFWGVLTALLIVFFVRKINPKLTFLVTALTLVWFPLLETGRWAWNPNLIPFWIISGLILMLGSNKYARIFAGVAFGLAVHNHYYSVFAVGIFMFLMSVNLFYKKKYIDILFLGFGFVISILPFILFDLRHPPGIFIPNLFSQSKSIGGGLNLNFVFTNFFTNIWSLMIKYTQTVYLAIPLTVFGLLLIFQDIKKRSFSLIYLAPWIFQALVISFMPQFFPHYLIPGLIFFVVWITWKRPGFGKVLSYAILITLLIGGVFSIYPQMTRATFIPNIPVAREIEKTIKKDILLGDLKNVNIAVLASPDLNTVGKKYRDLLLVDGNTHILTKDEYSLSDHLFVVSSSNEKTVRADAAFEMHRFRKGSLVDVHKINNSGWFIYHFTKNI